jgi:cobalt-zinc-cadmium efflux system outer membrane protein
VKRAGLRRTLMARAVLALSLAANTSAAVDDDKAAVASPSPPLGLDEVLAAAERGYPLMRAAELERRIAEGDVTSAEGGFDLSWKARGTLTPLGYYDSVRVETTLEKPTPYWGTTAFAGYKLGTGEFPVYDGRLETLDYGELRAGVQVPLWRNGPVDRRRANLERAEIGVKIADLSIMQQKIELRRAAAQRYWAWVAAGRRVAIAEALRENVSQRDAGIGQRVDAGDLPPIERVENQRALEQRRAGLAQARRALEQATIELGLFLRDARGEPSLPGAERLPAGFPDVPAVEPLALGADQRLARAERPEARVLELQREQQQVERAWAENQLAPGVDVQVAVARDFGPRSDVRPDLEVTVVEASLLLDIPVQTRAQRGRVEAALASAERLCARAELAGDRIDADVRDAHSAIAAARDRIQATRREVALALELEQGERTRFEQGDSNLLLVNLREQQTAEALSREVDALFDYFRAQADLRAARGQ